MNDNQQLAKIEPMPSVMDEPRSPQALMRRATDVAGICREIVLKTACEIQGRKFVRVEGWESIATAHGCFAGAEDADRVYDTQGNHIGYKAKGVLRNSRGEVIATGEGYVGFDEKDRKGNPTWKNRAEYAGKAMAQTRAISRTCRGVFAHVVVLIDAGLSTTPAEEVPDGGFDDNARASRAKPANVSRIPTNEIERIANEFMQLREAGQKWSEDLSGMPPKLHARTEILALQQYESRAACQDELSKLFQSIVEAGQTGENALRGLWLAFGANSPRELYSTTQRAMAVPETSSGASQVNAQKSKSNSASEMGKKSSSVSASPNESNRLTPATQAPAGSAASPSAPPAQVATEEQRQRWIRELKRRGEYAVGYCRDKEWLLPPAGDFPGEPIELLEARHVPTTKRAAVAILAELDSLLPEDFVITNAPPATAPQPAQSEPDHHDTDWYQFPVPFGKDAGKMLGELEKNTLFGWWSNFTVEREYKGKPRPKDKIETDRTFRVMLDKAGVFYKFEEPDQRD